MKTFLDGHAVTRCDGCNRVVDGNAYETIVRPGTADAHVCSDNCGHKVLDNPPYDPPKCRGCGLRISTGDDDRHVLCLCDDD